MNGVATNDAAIVRELSWPLQRISEPRSTPHSKPFYKDMSAQVFVGMAVGALVGWAWPQSADLMRTLGDLFIRLISVFVGLIIFCAVVHGVATVREARRVARALSRHWFILRW
jgi:Na+/H+-dicarboxylate symporter